MGDFGTEIFFMLPVVVIGCLSLSEERGNKEQTRGSSNTGRHVALKYKSQKNRAPAQNCI